MLAAAVVALVMVTATPQLIADRAGRLHRQAHPDTR